MGEHVAVDQVIAVDTVEVTDDTVEADLVASGDWHAKVIIEPDGPMVYSYHGHGETRTDAIHNAVELAEDVHPGIDNT